MEVKGDCVLTNGIKELLAAKENGYALAHFNINNLEWIRFILEECEELMVPVILGVSEGAAKYMGGFKTVSSMVKALLSDLHITIPVILHVDHASSFEVCKTAIDEGFTSVMIDASRYPIDENIAITKQVVDYAHERGVLVEGEIGHIGGTEDNVTGTSFNATLEECEMFYQATKVDTLAPALGSVHGFYKGEPNLDFKTMKAISDTLNIPLVLHGGTGIPVDKIKEAISCGICKININTELQVVWSKAVREFLKNDEKAYDPRKIIKSGEGAMKEKIRELVQIFGTF